MYREMPTMSTNAVDAAEVAVASSNIRSTSSRFVASPDQGDAADLVGDVVGQAGVDVDAHEASTVRGERVRRLATDALARADHHEATAVEPEPVGVIGYGGVVEPGHGLPLVVGRSGPDGRVPRRSVQRALGPPARGRR